MAIPQPDPDTDGHKSQILALISHEMRTPLSAIIGMSEFLARDDSLGVEQHQVAQHIYTASIKMLSVINGLLDFTKLESGRSTVNVSRIGWSIILDDVMRTLEVLNEDKLEITTHLDPKLPEALWGDEHKLRQSFLNLAHNALKFTPQGTIELRVELVEPIGSDKVNTRVSVKDTGIGISESFKSQLFQPFHQAGKGRQKHPGTGLGLSICKKFVELMDGEIGCESEEGKGSHFWFVVPLKTSIE